MLLAWQWPWETLVRAVSPNAARIANDFATGGLDPLARGGVLLPVCVGLLCGLAWAARRRGLPHRVAAVITGLAGRGRGVCGAMDDHRVGGNPQRVRGRRVDLG